MIEWAERTPEEPNLQAVTDARLAGANVAVLPPSCKKISVAGVKVAILPPSLQERTSLCGLSLTTKHGYGRE